MGLQPPDRAQLLSVLGDAQHLGFLGPGPVASQLDHALAFEPFVPPATRRAADLGSGGGVPALALALLRPSSQWTLVDAMARRSAFLATAVDALGLAARVTVLHARAEELPRTMRCAFDLVTARGFGPPPVLAECAAPLLEVGGLLVVSEPPGGHAGRWPVDGLQLLGLAPERFSAGPPAFACLRQVTPCPDRYPRRTGVPSKRPLW